MWSPLCGMLYTNDPLLLIGKSRPISGDSGFPPSPSEWTITICVTQYHHMSVSLNETFSFISEMYSLFETIYLIYASSSWSKDILLFNAYTNM